MKRQCERTWNSLRAQIMAQMARCEAEAGDDRLTSEEQRIFRIDEAEPYYGPTRAAGEVISRVLGLDPTAGQREWEAELGQPGKANRLIDVLANPSLDTETRSAIALLLLDHADRVAASGANTKELLARVRWHLRADSRVQARMRYWWSHLDGSAAVMEALN